MTSKLIISCSVAICLATIILEGLAFKPVTGECKGEKAMRYHAKTQSQSCRYIMSEETAELFDDDEEYDNLEVRKFLVCLYTKLGYYNHAEFNVTAIESDCNYYFCDPEINPKLKAAVNFCIDNELPDTDVDTDLVGAFTRCLNDKKKSDL